MPGSELIAVDESIDALSAMDPATLDGPALKQHVLGIKRARAKLEAVEARVVARFAESGEWASDAAYNAANWIVNQTGTSSTEARAGVRFAAVLRRMPLVADAFHAGEITSAHVRLVAACVRPRTWLLFERDEAVLVEQARKLRADDFAVVVKRWLELADPDGSEPTDEKNTFFMSRTLSGRLKGRFDLAGENAVVVEAALREKEQELFHRDTRNRDIDPTDPHLDRPPANRRARAFVELCVQGSTADGHPRRRKPAFNIFIDPVTFAGGDAGADAIRDIDLGGTVPLGLIELWRCDAEVARVVLDGEGAVLDLGRLQRTINDDQRRALVARDGGCAVPGCDRPAAWCDGHHVKWWGRDQGPTDIGNLCLLCRHHHRRIHTGHLLVQMVDGVPRFSLPDGREL